MGTNETILLQAQAGIESTRGTAVAATRKVYAQIEPSYSRALMDFQDTSGTWFGRRRAAYGREKISFSASDVATYEDAAWWLKMAVDGTVTGSADAGTPIAYTYQFTPSPTADNLKAMTLEFGESGNQYESDQVMVNSLTLRMDSDNDSEPTWMIEADLMGRTWVDSTFTAALSDRATEPILARGTKLYIDDSGGTIGTTQVTGKLISASYTINNNLHYKAFAEDTRGYAPNKVGRGALTADAEITFEFAEDGEFGNYRNETSDTAPVLRLVRLQREGSQIHGSSVVNKTFRLDIWGYWSSWARSDREGNLIATMTLQGFYDTTAAAMFKATVINQLATLP